MSNLTEINNQELLNFIRGDEYQGPISFAAQDLGVNEALIDFIRDEHIKVEGGFSANNQLYVIYSKIVTPSELEAVKDKGIFASLKLYGSSGKYKGVVDAKGKSIIPNMYYTITPFMNNIMKIEYKGNKFGLMRLSGEIILEPKYDRIDPLGELVFAVSFGGKLGFMNLNGQEVIPFMYEIPDNEVVFHQGLACVEKKINDDISLFGYINHKNEEVIPFKFGWQIDFDKADSIKNVETIHIGDDLRHDTYLLSLDGTITFLESEYVDNFDYDEYNARHVYDESRRTENEDNLDAFEGDASNRWNID